MNKSWTTLIYLSVIVGYLGADRFYVGKIGSGIFKLLTLGGLGIWWIVDIIAIAGGKFTDASGKLVEKPENAKKHIGISIGILVLLVIIGNNIDNPAVNAVNAINEDSKVKSEEKQLPAINEDSKVKSEENQLPTAKLSRAEKVAMEQERKYEIVLKSGSTVDKCVRAGAIAEFWLQAENEEHYEKWKKTQKS